MRSEAERLAEGRHDHRKTWIASLIAGGITIAVCHFLNSGPWWPAGILSAMMLLHGIAAHRNRHVSPDTKGDGIYYLGFLFTFGAMLSALLGLAPADNDNVGIIRNFGVALTTTILGLAGRVWFAMSKEASGDEAKTEVDLLVNEISKVRTQVGSVRQQLEAHVDLLSGFARDFDEAARSMMATVAGTTEEAAEVADGITEVVGRTRELASKATSDMEFGAAAMADASGRVTDSFTRLSASLDGFGRGFPDVGANAGRAVGALTEVVEATQSMARDMRRAAEAAEEGARNVAGTGPLMAGLQSEIERITVSLKGAVDGLAGDLSVLRSNATGAGATLQSLSAVGENIRGIAARAAGLDKEIRLLGEAVTEARGSLAAVSTAGRGMANRLHGDSSTMLRGAGPVLGSNHGTDGALGTDRSADAVTVLGSAVLGRLLRRRPRHS